MLVRLLGPVDVPGAARPVRGTRRRSVLAVLALHAGEVVPAGQLVDRVWHDAPPTGLNTLQSHVSQLRHALGDRAAIVARAPGYVLDLGAEGTDVGRAERLARRAARASDPAVSAAHLREALALWRGQPLADVAGSAWLDEQTARLRGLHENITRALVDARLALGESAALIPQLRQLARDHPFDEGLHWQLILALYRAGRQSDALATYQRLRHTLDEELGVRPGQRLRDLETAILRQDSGLDLPGGVTVPGGATVSAAPPEAGGPDGGGGPPVPAQLPLAVRHFAGRAGDLARLDALLDGPPSAGTAVAAVSGTAGVGKTTLAVHWAHRVADRFPDGQLYVNLRGYDPGRAALDPAQIIPDLLDALGVAPQTVPAGAAAQAALYRSVLADRRVLVVLDNARDAEQVRPLLPGSPGCLAVVTSRDRLTPLVAVEGAVPVTLDLLAPAEANDLLARRVGPARVAQEEAAAGEIVSRCARLPLALAIAAARAATEPALSLSALAAELRTAEDTLAVLDGGDAGTDVRVVFWCSYRTLSGPGARLFRLLGLHPGPEITVDAAASTAGLPVRLVRPLLSELTRANLITEHLAGRYRLHDLLRAYAAEQAGAAEGSQALRRLVDHHLHTAHEAALRLGPHVDSITLDAAAPGVVVGAIRDHDAARDWLHGEQQVLLTVVAHAAASGLDGHVWRLAWCLNPHLHRTNRWHDLLSVQRTALRCAQRAGDRLGQAHATRCIGLAYRGAERFDEARAQFTAAMELFGEAGYLIGVAHAHASIAWIDGAQNACEEALEHNRLALALYRTAGNAVGQAISLSNLGWYATRLGRHHEALEHCERALLLQQELGDHYSEAHTWDSLAHIHRALGRPDEAIGCLRRSLDLFRRSGDRYSEAGVLRCLGETYQLSGKTGQARDLWRSSLRLLDAIGHVEAAEVRALLETT
ncbi:tetratricopeptide repeat protein [Dactylosporangium sp. NBC_01737]|uniref:AfsR/SARP family transcriptional regulator n=1 Tax=Dactylosporangium sp. NBC_01737 TaxID=2975959 RepID=UPI002E11C0A3|nr:tetratricopeptide repeat protein [Dactylosporangium sp. NBC_01737]